MIAGLGYFFSGLLLVSLPHSPSETPVVEPDKTELKFPIASDGIQTAVLNLGLKTSEAESRYIYFYDTRKKKFSSKNIFLRARMRSNGSADSVVKLRPFDATRINQEWLQHPDFEVDWDELPQRSALSASLAKTVKTSTMQEVMAGKRPITDLFSASQQRLIKELMGRGMDEFNLGTLGPIQAYEWELGGDLVKPSLTIKKIDVELWNFPNGAQFLEVSATVPSPKARICQNALQSFLSERNLTVGEDSLKTEAVFKFLEPVFQ